MSVLGADDGSCCRCGMLPESARPAGWIGRIGRIRPAPAFAPVTVHDKENASHVLDAENDALPVPSSSLPSSPAGPTLVEGGKKRRRLDSDGRRPGSSKRPAGMTLFEHRQSEKRKRTTGDAQDSDRIAITTQGAKVIFPRRLARPEPAAVSRDALAAIDPSLADVAPAYVLEKLQPMGPQLVAMLAKAKAAPTSGLPQDLEVLLPASEAEHRTQFPTHMLAVHSKQPRLQTNSRSGAPQLKRKVTLFPAHDVVLVANCAHLPPFPPSGSQLLAEQPTQPQPEQQSQPAPEAADADEPEDAPASPISINLPVVPMCLPSPTTFPIVQSYIYTKRGDTLLARLLPPVPGTPPNPSNPATVTPGSRPQITSDRSETMRNLVSALSDAYKPNTLLTHALTAHGLWSNVCVLGVHDEKLWRVLDLAWEVLMGALEASALKHPEDAIFGPAPALALASPAAPSDMQVETSGSPPHSPTSPITPTSPRTDSACSASSSSRTSLSGASADEPPLSADEDTPMRTC
ncbi:hypothetical protein AURDEDRAFT_185632 [Auricularia subglabra TFB-10046 SS5]|nr:hypothetical protein AURDEDRAFT_185632 [Auricularia subglabra TFB-10046 SS5]